MLFKILKLYDINLILSLIMKSINDKKKRPKIYSEIITPLSNRKYYRYVNLPVTDDKNLDIMNLFFGDDRSYRLGCPFDDGDIIFEFVFKEGNTANEIEHHPLSFRGPIKKSEVTITNIFINNRNENYYIVHHLISYRKRIRKLINNLGKEYQNKVIYFDILRERLDHSKLPKSGWWESRWKGLVYDAIISYN